MKQINFKRIALIAVIVLVVAVNIFIAWANDAYPPTDVALQALKTDARATVKEDSGLITFLPTDNPSPAGGFIFYPGGRVDYRAYAAPLRAIAERGFFVALVPAPLNLAFFNVNAAAQVMELYPTITHWFVGGHSLGGVAAASFASSHMTELDGIIFWASYPADDSLKDSNLRVLSIYGSMDMAGMEPFEKSRAQLPADTQFVVIEGANHAQFGDYGPQEGDRIASISSAEQQSQVVNATVKFLEEAIR